MHSYTKHFVKTYLLKKVDTKSLKAKQPVVIMTIYVFSSIEVDQVLLVG